MLYRSYNLLDFIRNVNRYHTERFVFQIGLTKRHASILITHKYNTQCRVQLISNSQKALGSRRVGKWEDWKYSLLMTVRSTSDRTKEPLKDEPTKEEGRSQTLQQKVTELSEENLGQLKERALSVESTDTDKKEEQAKKKVEQNEQQKVEDAQKEDAKKTKRKVRTERPTSSLERNFITPIRAMSDFLLKPDDLETLPKTKRRSPHDFEPPITVYWRKDVEAKAIEVWGSHEALQRELQKKDAERRAYQESIFTLKRKLRDYRRQLGSKPKVEAEERLLERSDVVVMIAVIINGLNCLFKLVACLLTGSHSLFAECIHSGADMINQILLAYGIRKSLQNPNPDHPYGYTNMRYVSSLISGVGIFCGGSGLSVYHGIHGLLFPVPVDATFWALFVLGGSLISEGATLILAIRSIKKGAEKRNMSFLQYVLRGQDACLIVVLMEDFAAMLGILIASGSLGLTSFFDTPKFDAVGSLLVGGLLAGVAMFIIWTNTAALVGRSIPQHYLNEINAELEADIMVRAIYDVKGIDIGNNLIRYKAEIDFDSRELTKSYLEKHDLTAMMEEVKGMKDVNEFEQFFLKHGENIGDMLGGEIDRIELKLKTKFPEIRHCDLEIL